MNWVSPPALQPGDTVAIISPCGPVQPKHLTFGINHLKAWGLIPIVHEHTFAKSEHGYLAGEDPLRLDGIKWAIEHNDVRAIFCGRGGYGAMRLLPKMGELVEQMRASPRWFCGFSDVTAFHLFWASHKVHTLHGPVLKSFEMLAKDTYFDSLPHTHNQLFSPKKWTLPIPTTIQKGQATGRLLGGNLSLVASLLASPYCPDLSGSILMLEDVTEPDYRLDRLLTTLHIANIKPAGIVLGDFTQCEGVYVQAPDILSFLGELAKMFNCPIAASAPFGHDERNMSWTVGKMATLDATKGTLTIEA